MDSWARASERQGDICGQFCGCHDPLHETPVPSCDQARPTGGFFKQFVVGTLPYMAPELLRRGGTSSAAADFRPCDVYSLAITANEILTRCIPYADALTDNVQLHTILEARYNHDDLVTAITTRGMRPALPPPAACPAQLVEMVQLCWAEQPEERPTAATAEASIRAILGTADLVGDISPRDEIAALVQSHTVPTCSTRHDASTPAGPATSAPAATVLAPGATVALSAGTPSATAGAADQTQNTAANQKQTGANSSGIVAGGPSIVQTGAPNPEVFGVLAMSPALQAGASGPALTAPRDVFGDSTVAALARACGATQGKPHRAAAEATAGGQAA